MNFDWKPLTIPFKAPVREVDHGVSSSALLEKLEEVVDAWGGGDKPEESVAYGSAVKLINKARGE